MSVCYATRDRTYGWDNGPENSTFSVPDMMKGFVACHLGLNQRHIPWCAGIAFYLCINEDAAVRAWVCAA